ncbi:Uncharacterised protein [uncultured archaeon]|nr:Uncharacterised protein [uncultured archaeon]
MDYQSAAFDKLETYSVRNFLTSSQLQIEIAFSSSQKLDPKTVSAIRAQLRRSDKEYLLDGFLMDLALSPSTSRDQKVGLISLMQDEEEIACGLKALQRREHLSSEDVEKLARDKLSSKIKNFYNL